MSATAPCIGLDCDVAADLDLYSINSKAPAKPQTTVCLGIALNCNFPTDLDLYSLDGLNYFTNSQLTFVPNCADGVNCLPPIVVPPGVLPPVVIPRIDPVTQEIPVRITCCNGQAVEQTVYVSVTALASGNVSGVASVFGALKNWQPPSGHGFRQGFVISVFGPVMPTYFINVTPDQAKAAITEQVKLVTAEMMKLAAKIESSAHCNTPPIPPTPPPPPPPTPLGQMRLSDISNKFACFQSNYSGTIALISNFGPIDFTVLDGALPPDTKLAKINERACMISGPTTLPGSFTFTIQAADVGSIHHTARAYTVNVLGIGNAAPDSQGIIPLPGATPCVDYNVQLQAVGGNGPFTFTFDPSGAGSWISVSVSGQITGTPQAVDGNIDNNFIVTVTDADGHSCSSTVRISVGPCAAVTISPTTAKNGVVGDAYSQQLTATGGTAPLKWAQLGALPPGLLLSASTGLISGIPITPGVYATTITVTDKCGCGTSADVHITIGTIGNDAFTTVCPGNHAITATVPADTYVNVGAYAGYTKEQLNTLASAAAVNALSGQSCAICNFSLDVDATNAQNANSTCLVILTPIGSGTGAGHVSVNGSTNLKNALDLLTGFSTHGTYNWVFTGQTSPPYAFTTWYP